MDITLKGDKENYKIVGEKGIGSLKIDGKSQSGSNSTYGSGNNVIKVDGGVGSINIDFE